MQPQLSFLHFSKEIVIVVRTLYFRMSGNGRQNVYRQSSNHHTLYKKIDLNQQALPQPHRQPFNHSSYHRASRSQAITIHSKHNLTTDDKPPKRVGFKCITNQEQAASSNKLKLIFQSKPRTHQKQASQPISLKNIKSLESSFVCPSDRKESFRSKKSINPELNQCKMISQEILKKLQVFDDSNFCERQVTGWLSAYFKQQRSVLGRIFLKPKKKALLNKKPSEPELQRNIDILNTKIQTKQKDTFLCDYRFVTVAQLILFSQFIESLYVEKSKIKMKQVETCLKIKSTQLFQHLKQEPNKDYLFAIRNKPNEISNFVEDLVCFESQLGPLKRIATINRNRFKLLNDTDLVVDAHMRKLNQQVESKKIDVVQIEALE